MADKFSLKYTALAEESLLKPRTDTGLSPLSHTTVCAQVAQVYATLALAATIHESTVYAVAAFLNDGHGGADGCEFCGADLGADDGICVCAACSKKSREAADQAAADARVARFQQFARFVLSRQRPTISDWFTVKVMPNGLRRASQEEEDASDYDADVRLLGGVWTIHFADGTGAPVYDPTSKCDRCKKLVPTSNIQNTGGPRKGGRDLCRWCWACEHSGAEAPRTGGPDAGN